MSAKTPSHADAEPATVESYIAAQPAEVQALLQPLRAAILAWVGPDAQEAISYAIPTVKLGGRNLVHYAAFKRHIGLYPGARVMAAFKPRLGPWVHSKGAVQFPLNQPLPMDLVEEMVRAGVADLRR